jgi:hypothetical protein
MKTPLQHLFSALKASAGTINARALALGVAVEGIVKKLIPKAGSLPDGLKPKVKQLRGTLGVCALSLTVATRSLPLADIPVLPRSLAAGLRYQALNRGKHRAAVFGPAADYLTFLPALPQGRLKELRVLCGLWALADIKIVHGTTLGRPSGV